jgi:hypothetical protein
MYAKITPLGENLPGAGIDNSLPAVPGFPDNTLPEPPPGIWPPPVVSHPIVPAPPHTPPGTIWPPVHPAHPDQGLPSGGGSVDNTLPSTGRPPRPDHDLPGNTKFWIVAGIPGYGWKYVCIDVSLVIDNTLPTPPAKPSTGLPPSAAPKA